MTSPFLSDGRQWAWNTSSLELAKECPRKYYLAYRQGWASRRTSYHLVFGGIYAQALELYHRLRANAGLHSEGLFATVTFALTATWRDGEPWASDDNRKNRQTLIRSIVWYLEEFENDACKTVVLADGRAAVELSSRFAHPSNPDILLCQHNDRLVEYAGDVYIQDQKTTGSSLGSYYFKKFDMSSQMSQYSVAAEIVWRVPVKGVMIDAAQIAVGFTAFSRGFTFRTSDQNVEWLDESYYHIRKIWEAQAAGFPRNDAACGNYGGCQFVDICSKSRHVREEFLRTNFVQMPLRNPLEE